MKTKIELATFKEYRYHIEDNPPTGREGIYGELKCNYCGRPYKDHGCDKLNISSEAGWYAAQIDCECKQNFIEFTEMRPYDVCVYSPVISTSIEPTPQLLLVDVCAEQGMIGPGEHIDGIVDDLGNHKCTCCGNPILTEETERQIIRDYFDKNIEEVRITCPECKTRVFYINMPSLNDVIYDICVNVPQVLDENGYYKGYSNCSSARCSCGNFFVNTNPEVASTLLAHLNSNYTLLELHCNNCCDEEGVSSTVLEGDIVFPQQILDLFKPKCITKPPPETFGDVIREYAAQELAEKQPDPPKNMEDASQITDPKPCNLESAFFQDIDPHGPVSGFFNK